ncbi:MAG: AI-2E family transporter, partial [Chloroflexi bacterium]
MKNPRARTNLRDTSGRSTGTLPSLIAFGSFVLIIACLYWAQAVLIPIALAIMLTFLLSPVAGALERTGLGRLPSVIIIVVLTFSLLATIGWVVTIEFTSLGNELPKYTGNTRQKISDVRGAGKGGALENVQKAIDEVKDEIQKQEEPVRVQEKPREVVVKAAESSTFWPIPLTSAAMLEPLAAAGLVIVLVIFMLIQREDLRNRLIRLIGYG